MHYFWKLEEIPLFPTSSLSPDEQECERHFNQTHTRDEHSRYTVRLPFKYSIEKLRDSQSKAKRMMTTLSERLAVNQEYSTLYSAFIDEYERLHHMIRVPAFHPEPRFSFYLPHHGVFRQKSLTTKLRVVFNGSSRTDSGISLNDVLHTGAKLQVYLFDVLIWFRQYRYVFSTDIEKMYRQIQIHKDDWDFQRIL